MWIIYAVVILVVLWAIFVFNGFIRKQNKVSNAWSDIDVQLKRRYDLIPNLVSAVKGYRDHEASVLEKVTQARGAAVQVQDGSVEQRIQAEDLLTRALSNLFAVAENYPDLKASSNFIELQEQLSETENKIEGARRYYNAAVREFNNAIHVFPAKIAAALFGFKEKPFFEATDQEKKDVAINI